jgi:Arc/MetJ-type ribon-helix-helix transcriptional regulator
MEYFRGMRKKTSVSLDPSVWEAMEPLVGTGNRSEFVEEAIREHIKRRQKQAREARDRAILERVHARHTQESHDILGFQVLP